jgi:hypothetical protein
MRSQEHQKIRKTAAKKSTKHRSRGGQRLRKGDDKRKAEDAAILPEYIQPRQSEVSLRMSVK